MKMKIQMLTIMKQYMRIYIILKAIKINLKNNIQINIDFDTI